MTTALAKKKHVPSTVAEKHYGKPTAEQPTRKPESAKRKTKMEHYHHAHFDESTGQFFMEFESRTPSLLASYRAGLLRLLPTTKIEILFGCIEEAEELAEILQEYATAWAEWEEKDNAAYLAERKKA